MYQTTGIIRYAQNSAFLDLCPDLGLYYFSLIPKYLYAKRQMYPTHCSFIRKELRIPHKEKFWNVYAGDTCMIEYTGEIIRGGNYFWLNCWCERLCEIREELGLKKFTSFENDCYHFTIGNCKNV